MRPPPPTPTFAHNQRTQTNFSAMRLLVVFLMPILCCASTCPPPCIHSTYFNKFIQQRAHVNRRPEHEDDRARPGDASCARLTTTTAHIRRSAQKRRYAGENNQRACWNASNYVAKVRVYLLGKEARARAAAAKVL